MNLLQALKNEEIETQRVIDSRGNPYCLAFFEDGKTFRCVTNNYVSDCHSLVECLTDFEHVTILNKSNAYIIGSKDLSIFAEDRSVEIS